MPGVSFQCPSCAAALRSQNSLDPAARVRCTKCGVVFSYGDAGRKAGPTSVTADRDTRPRRTNRDDEDDRPARGGRSVRKEKATGPTLALILGLTVGGGAGLLFVVVGIVVLVWVMMPKAASPVAATPISTTIPPAADPFADTPQAPIMAPAPLAAGVGGLAPDVLDRVKKAAVYIRVTNARGVASGSGFFEASSSHVLTNAHVVGMLHADEAPPQRIDIVLNSGEKGEKTVPGRIVTVDRASDLAVLNVDFQAAGLPGPPASLTVASAAGLHETQEVYVFGFPLGEGLGKEITVSKTSVSSLRKDKDGFLSQVQVNGGMHHGNSGGPVVDAAGNVVGVAVAGIENTQINFAIPGDAVRTVFNGRCSGISVGEAVRKNGQIAVPVDVSFIDPMHRIRQFSLDWWAGDSGDSAPPSLVQPAAPAPPVRQTTVLQVQQATGAGHVELVLPSLPLAGKVLWVQPMFVNGAGESHWSAGIPVALAPPVEAKPAVLMLKPQVGRLRVNLKSTATMQVRASDGEKHTLVSNIESRLLEDTRAVTPTGLAQLFDGIEHFALGISVDNKPSPPSPRTQRIVQDVGKLSLVLAVDAQGNVVQKHSEIVQIGLAPPPSPFLPPGLRNQAQARDGEREALNSMGDQMLQSLEISAVPLPPAIQAPGGMVQPEQKWSAVRNVPIDTVDSYQTAAADMTYTFRGVRTMNGREFGVVGLSGVVRPPAERAGPSGNVSGTAMIDLAAGRVSDVHALVDVVTEVRFLDETLRSNGKLEVKLTRDAP